MPGAAGVSSMLEKTSEPAWSVPLLISSIPRSMNPDRRPPVEIEVSSSVWIKLG